MVGYKLLNGDMSAKYGDMTYELGKTYEIEGELKLYSNGFHFCNNFAECLRYYDNLNGDKRLFKVDSLDGKVITSRDKHCSSKIKLIEEIEITEEFIECCMKNIDNDVHAHITKFQSLTEEFIEWCMKEKNNDDLVNGCIAEFQSLSKEFSERHKNDVEWEWTNVAMHQILSEEFIERHYEDAKWDWDYIAIHQKLSMEFLERHWEDSKWDWDCIAMHQSLSEEFLERHVETDKWDWDYITSSMRDILSEDLKRKIKEAHPEARIFKNRNRKKEF